MKKQSFAKETAEMRSDLLAASRRRGLISTEHETYVRNRARESVRAVPSDFETRESARVAKRNEFIAAIEAAKIPHSLKPAKARTKEAAETARAKRIDRLIDDRLVVDALSAAIERIRVILAIPSNQRTAGERASLSRSKEIVANAGVVLDAKGRPTATMPQA